MEQHIKCLEKTSNKMNSCGMGEEQAYSAMGKLRDGNNVLKSWQNAKWMDACSGWDTFYATS